MDNEDDETAEEFIDDGATLRSEPEKEQEEDELEEHIEEGQVLPHSPKLVSAPG